MSLVRSASNAGVDSQESRLLPRISSTGRCDEASTRQLYASERTGQWSGQDAWPEPKAGLEAGILKVPDLVRRPLCRKPVRRGRPIADHGFGEGWGKRVSAVPLGQEATVSRQSCCSIDPTLSSSRVRLPLSALLRSAAADREIRAARRSQD